MSNVLEICRAAKADADEDWSQHILWGRTPFPCGSITAQSLYRAASGQARAERNGLVLCDLCEAIAAPGSSTCRQCDAALKQAGQQ